MSTTTITPQNLAIGQRVQARFGGPGESREYKLGVVSGTPCGGSHYMIQFQPCGAHYGCSDVRAYGDANGWTDQEYRIERESSYGSDRAANVEAERRERYPNSPFSAYRGA